MQRRRDPEHLRAVQYRDSGNLAARISIHERFSTNPHGWHEWIFETMGLRAGLAVLEVGAGAGTLWSRNAGRVPAIDLIVSDLSVGMLADARRALDGLARAPRWAVCDAQRLPFVAGAFDVVVANAMLYHVPDLDLALGELRRVLRSGGTLFASTFGLAHLRELYVLLDRTGRGHVRFDAEAFGLESGANALQRCFGSVETRRYEDALLIDDAEPLLAYVSSMIEADIVAPIAEGTIEELAHEAAATPGGFRITKDGGLLIAR